ncbi:uncharacterized protein LOC106140133 isoform X1 [Amyelois transitella]|uniref:uncharacterized protein LOC106140133 isoform X1 n=2 Tax=Amyelois transitella TaxID=680683 RepID=UPI00298F8E73|nr:uncharacterized protein LOC106140133 isoform X1 [Amyelois transitella]
MSDLLDSENIDNGRMTRPSLAQLKAVVEFMEKYPDLAYRKLRYGVSQQKFKKRWIELSNIANSIDGAIKSTKGWIKFWSDKRRSIMLKQKQIEKGKLGGSLSALEQKIIDLSEGKPATGRKKRGVKEEPCNGDDDHDSLDDIFDKNNDELDHMFSSESDERQLGIMEKLVDVMGQQATAMSQVAQASLDNSKSLERLADAAHVQALAVNRLASTFETISSSVHDVRNALMGIDYTMKRCYGPTAAEL